MLISTGGTIRGKISPISAVIHQEINGEYSCQVSIPLEDNLAEYFIADAIVYLDDANGKTQQFRLERPERTLDALTAFGWHITYDLAQDMVVSKKYTSAAGSTVWADLLQAGIQETRFTGTADSSDTNSLTIVRQSVLSALIGDQDNSYLSRWGGEIDRDNFTVAMKTQLGEDRDYRIIYRKNLTGIHVTVDQSTVVNRIVPTYLNANDAATLLPEVYIDADSVAETAVPHARHIHYSDIRVGAEVDEVVPYPTTASAEAEVRARVAALYASGIDVPLLTVEIGFVQLRNTLEYANYAALEIVQLGDTIGAEYEDYSWTSRVVAYDWDAVLGRYNNITLGNVRPSASDMSNRIVDAATIAANAALYQRTSELTGAIASAQTTADGKNTVYYSSTEPTGGTYIKNDIWFDTDNSNKMYLHDGSAWVAVQFGENAIADLAITDAKIANATISNAKIANVDAGKLTAGTIDVARLGAGTITFDKLASAAVTSITDTIDLGGRNLLRNTGTSVTNANYRIAMYDMGDEWPVAGETYTLSIKFTLGADRTHLSLYTIDGTVLLTTVADADKNSLGVASKIFTMSYAVGKTPADGYTALAVYQMLNGGSTASTIEWLKLEKGNKATDWTPAPEDYGALAYEDVVEASKLGSTVIEGGYIKTGLIDASRIDTGTLNAARIAASSITFDKLASTAVTSITDTIDLGGRNLLKDTGAAVTNANYLMKRYSMGDEWPVAGETYTLSVKFTLGADRTHLSLYTPEGTVLLTTVADADKNSLGVAVKTFTMSYAPGYTPADGYPSLAVYQMLNGGSTASTIEWLKLEKGNKATDWTPAPEDKADAADLGDLAYEDLVESAKLGSTVIEGGLIKSTLLTADNVVTGKLQSVDGKAWFDLDTPEIVQTATIDGKDTRVEMSPDNPFKLTIDGQDHIYVTGASGFSGANILVTSRYDINQDGVVDWRDMKIMSDYILHKDIKPGTAWPAGYPTARMDFNGDGSVNSIDATLLARNSITSDRIVDSGVVIGIANGKLYYSNDYGDTVEYFSDIRLRSTATSSGSSSTAWIQIAEIEFTAQYQYASTKIEVIGPPSSAGAGYGATIYLSIIQQSALGNNPVGAVYVSDCIGLSTSSVKAVLTTVDEDSSIIELYVQAVHQYKRVTTRVLTEKSTANTTDHTLGSWTASLPAGTQLTTTRID